MMRTMRFGLLALCALAIGCGDDGVSSDDGGSTSGSTTDMASTGTAPGSTNTSNGSTSDTTEGTTAADASSSDGGFEPPVPECGNGFVEADEECDDANDDDDDDCTSTCQLRCGLDWTVVSLPPTDTSDMDAYGVATDDRGGATVAGYLREITTDQRGNETILDHEGVVVRVSPEGASEWEVRLSEPDADVDVRGIAEDGMGNAYVAASVAINGEDSDIRLYKLGTDGTVLWTSDFDSAVDSAEDFAFGVAMGMDGAPVVSGQVRVAAGDDDVWVASFDASTGDILWSQTWSGIPSGTSSNEDGGPVAVGDDGTIYVFAREYVNFQTNVATLLAFDPMGTEATTIFTTDFGAGPQNQVPGDVAVAGDGSVLVMYTRVLAVENDYYVVRLDPSGGSELFSVDAATIAEAAGLDDADSYMIAGADPLEGGGVVVMGTLARSGGGTSWNETWVARYGEDDALDCVFVRESPQLGLVPSTLIGRAVSAAPSGRAVVAGLQIDEASQSLWIGAFRP